MKKVIFLYSGEGTSDLNSANKLLKFSEHWGKIERILKSGLDIDLETLWNDHIGRHTCPHSPLLTLTSQICLSELWQRWGYSPDAMAGHSIGELAAAYQAGLYDLEQVVLFAYQIGQVTARLEGTMLHGRLTEAQRAELPVFVSSLNFHDSGGIHVTVSGSGDEMGRFHKDRPDFVPMRLPHPWHHPDYAQYADQLAVTPSAVISEDRFASGVTRQFESRLSGDYWKRWMTRTFDFIGAVDAIKTKYGDNELTIIEIGFHPVLESCCQVFDRYTYAASMFRGEDEIQWILHQRRKLDPQPFRHALRKVVEPFNDRLDFATPLAYQDFTSITFVALTELIQLFFPSLAPQDFYRYKSIDQLIQHFGTGPVTESVAQAKDRKNEVAIAGMSCRFPSNVETLPQFWQMLSSRKDLVGSNPDRSDGEAGFLDDQVTRFDHHYFNISSTEAQSMDPQQILALELAEMLWKDAGLDPKTLDRKRIGVYIGAWNQDFTGNRGSVYYPTGTNPSMIAARISFYYDLRGPSWVSNTACSSSLVALHYAAKDIEAGRVDYAIAGGVNMILDRGFTQSMRNAGFLSKDDRCKTFDDSADGYVRAEGGGLLLLANKYLINQYYGTVVGSAVNQNGSRAQTITAPHPEAQEEVILQACDEAGILPQQMAYVECHGTGTKIGDPIEISAIQNTVAKDRDRTLYLGSIKSNLGHLESAAGMAGTIKSVLSLNFGKIPANLHFDRPNRFIDFEGHRLKVVSEETPIDGDALVGISSFGFGGTNAHIIIKGAQETHRKLPAPIQIPFDRDRSVPLKAYYASSSPEPALTSVEAPVALPAEPGVGVIHNPIRVFIKNAFLNLTGIATIDPEIALVEQGLDSMSVTELISMLETHLQLELDPDLVFDHPFLDQFIEALEEISRAAGGNGASNANSISHDDIAEKINALFFNLTNIERIDPEVELTEQGLDSMSITELVTQLEEDLSVDLDPDIVFEYPLIDQLVEEICATIQRSGMKN